MTSDEHVDVKLLNGTLTADRLKIVNSGEIVRFEGNVVMNLIMESPARRLSPSLNGATTEDAVRHRQIVKYEMKFMMQFFSRSLAAAALARSRQLASGDALAQGAMTGVPNAMQGFSQNRDQPIQIEAASLEMRDKKKEATFSGNVKVVQGDTTMTSNSLVVFYDSGLRAGHAAARYAEGDRNPGRCSRRPPGPAAVRRSAGWKPGLRRGHAEGSGRDRRDRDLRPARPTSSPWQGGVVLTKCKNVLNGDRLKVDMTTGVSRSNPTPARYRACSSRARIAGPASGGEAGPATRTGFRH